VKLVSNAYKASMKSRLRNRSYVQITFGNINTQAANDGEWVSNGETDFSRFETLDYRYDYGNPIATLELNRWSLDGHSVILSDITEPNGYISDAISDENGLFASEPIITREFSTYHSIPGMTIVFDTRCLEYPTKVEVIFYYGGVEVESVVQTLSNVESIINISSPNVDKIEIYAMETLPYRRFRIEYIMYGSEVVFTNDDISSTRQCHDVDPLSRRLPQETMSFTIFDYEHRYDPDNPRGVYSYIDKRAPVSIRFGYDLPSGETEWLKADNYILNARPTVKNSQATFSGTGLIGGLTDTYYKSKIGTKSFYDMAEDVLLDANLTLTSTGENPWQIDESLKEMYTTAVLPIDTHKNCLQLIAHAARCRLYTDDDNVIHIKPFGVTVKGIYKGEFSDNGHEYFSEWSTVDKGHNLDNTYVTLELNRWVMNGGNQYIISNTPSGRGYVSSYMTDENGAFTNVPKFIREFDVMHDLSVINFKFDDVLEECPTSMVVEYYSGDTLVDTQTVERITSPEITVNSLLAINCTRIEVSILGSLPMYRVRVSKVYYRETDFVLDFDSIDENSQKVSKIDELKAVKVTKYSYTTGNNTTLYEGSTSDTELHIEFSGIADNVNVSVTGGTVISSEIYGRAIDLILSDGDKQIVITGNSITENSITTTYAVSNEGEIDKEDNPLITSDELSAALANHVKSYLQMRNTYDVDYRGNPEMEVGDIIGLQTQFTDEMDALILVDSISFSGSLSGTMKVKGLI